MGKICIGQMITPFSVERFTPSDDDYGGQTHSWAEVATGFGAIKSQSGFERMIYGRLDTPKTFVMWTHYGISITEKDRVKLTEDNRVFNVREVEDWEERHQFLKITMEVNVTTS